MLNTEKKLLCIASHLCIFILLPIIPPLVIYFISRDEFVKDQVKEALVFQIGLMALLVVGILTSIIVIGIFLILASVVMGIVFPIIATIENVNGRFFKYPITTGVARKI